MSASPQWFAETEPARREGVERVIPEVSGSLVIDAPAGPFTLTARADRIDHRGGGARHHRLQDGQRADKPKPRRQHGLRPQLPLEAAIALGEAGFAGVPHLPVTELRYISATGSEPPGDRAFRRQRRHRGAGQCRARQPHAAHRPLRRCGDALPALRRARFDYRYDDYEHLARVAEWSVPGEDEVVDRMSGHRAEADIARTRRAQRDAADPRASVWVSANAGTGKTHVLTQRVLRLLLAGTKPERILCLTYTKAAAAEMAKRVFDTLALWVTLPNAELARPDRRAVRPPGAR